MNNKTPAELQMDFLRKLKDQQKKKNPSQHVAKRSKKAKKTKRRPRVLHLPAAAWAQLAEALASRGISPTDKRVSTWAAELLISVPISILGRSLR